VCGQKAASRGISSLLIPNTAFVHCRCASTKFTRAQRVPQMKAATETMSSKGSSGSESRIS
jgi:hypothetical protein